MKKILGLDLGTNSIGWALIESDFENKTGQINALGSRIIPMDQNQLTDFKRGNTISQTADRTKYRGVRRLYQKDNLRRERLHRVLNILGFLPVHYSNAIDFDAKPGQFKHEAKINYCKGINGKYEFIFMDSFNEMVKEFKTANPELFYIKKNGQETKIPYDWTLYYLRKKALTKPITKEELAWVILNFNQKRGYYQLRGEEEELSDNKTKTFEVLFVNRVVENGETLKKTGEKLYDIYFSNGWKYDRPTTKLELWLNKTKEFIVTTSETKGGETKRTFKNVDSEKDWIAIKKKTEQDLDQYISKKNGTVGTFIYESLLNNPNQKIRGRLIKTIERKYYKQELEKILKAQKEFHRELQNNEMYLACIEELYPHNIAHKANIKDIGFTKFFVDDIIFYQRPLKSKKSTIAGCRFEKRQYFKTIVDEKTNKKKQVLQNESIKVVPKSHPLYQEFRIWQWADNFRLLQKEKVIENKLQTDVDVTNICLQNETDFVDFFDFLNSKMEVEFKHVIQHFIENKKINKAEKDNYSWNYPEGKKYPMNETRAQILLRLKKVDGLDAEQFLSDDKLYSLWHIIYSVKDKVQYEKALKTFAKKNSLDTETFVKAFVKFPPFSNDYGGFSEKALKKLLPLMRMGKYWSAENIDTKTKSRIDKIIDGEVDDGIGNRVRENAMNLTDISRFKGLPLWLASYVVYDRHSESGDLNKWKSPKDIDRYLAGFKQHSLRNPIVEKVVTETLRTVRDIWKFYGEGEEDFFDEIHIELGRDLRNPADKRKKMSEKNTENENTNLRIKKLLQEMVDDGARAYSPSHQEILKIYEEGVFQNPHASFDKISEDEINKIRRNNSPSRSDILRYKLWLEQGYVSPYTGAVIPLSKLFSTAYQIEHIIPQSRYFDNSFSNKVICESEINQLKDNQTGYEFIKNSGGNDTYLSSQGKTVTILTVSEYENHCKQYFKNNRPKLRNLLSEDVPESFIKRQLNDTRYISKLILSLLSKIVREKNEQEATAKRLVPVTGSITGILKQDWGLNDKWNELIIPRFKRLNQITGRDDFTKINSKGIEIPAVPDDISKNFSKKRIDHRHHALDALVIAACTKDHINYISSINSNRKNYSLVSKLRKLEKVAIKNPVTGETSIRKVPKNYLLPWSTFPVDTKENLEKVVVSFKQNIRVINRTNNRYYKWEKQKDGNYKKQKVKQKGKNFAIRKPLHKETVSGLVKINEYKEISFNKALEKPELIVNNKIRKMVIEAGFIDVRERIEYFKKNPITVKGKKVGKLKVYTLATAVRTNLSSINNEKHVKKITDSGIRQILTNHLKSYTDTNGKQDFEQAFSQEGIDDLNKNIVSLNRGEYHKPIYSVRMYEAGNKFAVGYTGNNSSKFVEAAKGTNLYFAIYEDEKGKRNYETVPLNEAIAHQKMNIDVLYKEQIPIPLNPSKGKLLFILSPDDLVYVPTDEELENTNSINFNNLTKEQRKRIYKMVSTTKGECHFIPYVNASEIYKNENGTNSKSERLQLFFTDSDLKDKNDSKKGVMIKERCIKLKIDRLGNIERWK